MATHEVNCPVCGSLLRVYVQPHQGGMVEENIGLAAISPAADAAAALAKAREAAAVAQADAVKAAQAVLDSTKGGR